MHKSRQAIFDKHGCTQEYADDNNKIMNKNYDKFFLAYKDKLPLTGNKTHNGNVIIDHLLTESEKSRQKLVSILQASRRLAPEFGAIFGVPLRNYFRNPYLGFDVIGFDKHIKPKRNESTKDAIKRKYGDRAVSVVMQLLGESETHEPEDCSPVPAVPEPSRST